MDQTTHLSISGENNTVQVGRRNFIIRSDVPVAVGQDSGDDEEEDEDEDEDEEEGEWTQASQRQGQPGVPQVPNAVHSTPDLDISGSGHSVQTGKTCLQMPMDADPNHVSQIAAVRLPSGGGTFSPKVRIRGQNHDIQHGDVCIKVSSPTVPGQPPSPLSQASASANGAIPSAEPTTEGVEEEGTEDSDWEQSQHGQHNVHLRPPPLSSLQADGLGEETDLKTTFAPQPSLPHQESATGAQGQGDNPAKWQLLAPEERSPKGAKPQIPAKIKGDTSEHPNIAVPTPRSEREVDLKGRTTGLVERAEPNEDEDISNMPVSESDISHSQGQPRSNTVFNITSTSSITAQVESTSSRPQLSPGGDDDISNVSLDSTLKAAAAEPVDKSPSLSQSQGSDRSTGSLTTRTLTSSGQSQSCNGARSQPFNPKASRDEEIVQDFMSDVEMASSVIEADVFTSAVATKTSTSLKEGQQDWKTKGELDDGGSRKGEKIAEEPTMVKKSTYDRSHSLDTQPTEGAGLAEHHLGSFYSSQTAAAAAELRSGFTDNEISNDAIYEIQTDSVPEKTKSPSPERQRKWQNAKPSGVTAVNASVLSSGSQHVEIREQSMEDMTHHQHWGHQLSDDDDVIRDEDYDIENPGISKALSRHSPPLLLGIDSHFRSLDVLKSQSALPSLSARPSLQASSLVERVNRMEQVVDDVKRMTSEGQQTLESRMDRLEGMVEKVLQMMTTQTNNTPTTSNGSAPSSLQGNAHYGASGGDGPSHRKQASESVKGFPNDETARPAFYEQKGGYPKTGLEEEPPSYRQYGKAGKTRNVSFLSPEEALEPLRTMRSFKGDAFARPKERPFTSRHHEEGDKDKRGTKEAYKRTATGKKGVPAGTRDAYGDTKAARGHEGGTTGHDGGIRVYAGGLGQGSGGRAGTEAEFEGDDLEVTTSPKKPARKEFSRPLRPQSPPLDEEDVEEDSVAVSGRTLHAFSSDTLVLLEDFRIVSSRSEVTSDPVAFRLAIAVERAIQPDTQPMLPRAIGQCTMLVLDNSESMKGRPLQQAIKFANDFLDGIEEVAEQHSKEENVAIVTIGGGAKVIHHLTNDYNSLRSALEGIQAEGRSPFLEAILVCIGIFRTQKTMFKVGKRQTVMPRIIVVTDGKVTNVSQSHGPDSPAPDVKAKAELIRRLQLTERPVTWVPVDGADKTFMDSMANITGHTVAELRDVNYMANNLRLQLITGEVLACIISMPEAPVHLGECIRSHIEVLQPDLTEDFKRIVFISVLKNLSKGNLSILAREIMDEQRRSREEWTGEEWTGEKVFRTSTHPSKAQRKVAP